MLFSSTTLDRPIDPIWETLLTTDSSESNAQRRRLKRKNKLAIQLMPPKLLAAANFPRWLRGKRSDSIVEHNRWQRVTRALCLWLCVIWSDFIVDFHEQTLWGRYDGSLVFYDGNQVKRQAVRNKTKQNQHYHDTINQDERVPLGNQCKPGSGFSLSDVDAIESNRTGSTELNKSISTPRWLGPITWQLSHFHDRKKK